MPNLLSGGRPLNGTTGTQAIFITLPGAQISLGQTPNTSTGFTLVTGANGQLGFTSTIGGVYFNNNTIQAQQTNGNLVIQSTGTGTVSLNGNVLFNGQTINDFIASFTASNVLNFTATNLTVLKTANFTSATETVNFFGNAHVQHDFRVDGALDAYGNVTLDPANGIVYIRPSGVGTVVIRPDSTGQMDNVQVGIHVPERAAFTDVTITNLTVTGNTNIGALTFNDITLDNLTVNARATFNSTATFNSSTTITSTVDSTSTTTGALVVDGGVGIGKNVHVGGDVYSNSGSAYYGGLLYSPTVTVSTSTPASPRIGDFWIDPRIGVEYQYVPNGTGTVWIQFIGF
jgi:hypothetical protein